MPSRSVQSINGVLVAFVLAVVVGLALGATGIL